MRSQSLDTVSHTVFNSVTIFSERTDRFYITSFAPSKGVHPRGSWEGPQVCKREQRWLTDRRPTTASPSDPGPWAHRNWHTESSRDKVLSHRKLNERSGFEFTSGPTLPGYIKARMSFNLLTCLLG